MKFQNYINGRWTDAHGGKTFRKVNPATGEEIGLFPASGPEDARVAVSAAKKSFLAWSRTPVPERGRIMRRFAELLSEKKEEVAAGETREMGKILKESRGDVQEAIDTAYYAVGESRRFFGRTTPSELPEKVCLTFRKPVGVAAVITPWNFPAAIPCWKILPALLSGNTVVFKPSREAPLTASRLVELLSEAGVPPGVLNLVHGSGRLAGSEICLDPAVSVVSFTGSVETGAELGGKCGQLLKKINLELGGKNGQVVLDDADLDLAVEAALWGAFGTTGQRCTATSRLILQKGIHDRFVSRLTAGAGNLKLGNGLDEKTDMGPLVSGAQRERVHAYVKSAEEEGAVLECGGRNCSAPDCREGFFYEPTIFTGVTPEMRIAREEIFGPVLAVFRVDNLEQAVEIMNGVEYGLTASVFTSGIRAGMEAVESIEAGVVYLNSATIGAECHLPFGGVKKSGNGYREGGWAAYDIFTREETVYIDYSGKLQKAQIDVPL